MKTPALITMVLLSGCVTADVAFECPNGELLCEVLEITADRRPMATGVDITGVYVYQATEYALHENASLVPDPGPIVQGRDALFRVTVEPHDDWESRDVTGRLYFYEDGKFFAAFQDDLHLVDPSDLSQLQSTFNFEVPGDLLLGELSWEVQIVEADPDANEPGSEGENELGPYDLPLVDTMGGLRVYLVPVDCGSGLTDTSESQLEMYREAMFAHYGTPFVEIELGESFDWGQSVSSTSDWSALLSAVGELRGDRGIEEDVYIYGVFDGGSGGIAGLSNLAPSPGDAWLRASIGLGNLGQGSGETMVHEIGHAHGRSHTDGGCGSSGTDPNYPHEGGFIGNRGWDLRTGSLVDPDTVWDYMSYCNPTFVSDWTYEATHERIADINKMYNGGSAARYERTRWHAVYQLADGELLWGSDRDIIGMPGARWVDVELLDDQGQVLLQVDGRYSPYSHDAGGVVVFRPVPVDYTAVRVNGEILER